MKYYCYYTALDQCATYHSGSAKGDEKAGILIELENMGWSPLFLTELTEEEYIKIDEIYKKRTTN